MQRIYSCPWSADECHATEGHRQVIPESTCPRCHKAVKLQRHGIYPRWVISLMGLLRRLWIARFHCPACRHTISYLPDFALTYRPIGPETFEAFLDGKLQRADVRTFLDLLCTYRRGLESFSAQLIRTPGKDMRGHLWNAVFKVHRYAPEYPGNILPRFSSKHALDDRCQKPMLAAK